MELAMIDLAIRSPAERLKQAYATWSASKGMASDQWFDLFADQIEMRSVLAPDVPDDLAAHRFSRSGAMEYFQTLGRDWEMIEFEPERFIDGGDDVAMIGRCAWRNRATGKVVDTPKVDIWHYADGKAVTFLEMFDSLAFMRAIPFGDAMGVG
jgi:ketosteroid isomerase-like protein